MTDRILRADRLEQSMNIGKERRVAQFIRDYRSVAVQIGPRQWRLFFETGQINKNLPATDLNHICGAAPVQMATRQVVEQIKSWISNRANEFADIVRSSKLPPKLRKQLYAINRRRAWFITSTPLKGIDKECSSCGYVDRRNRRSQSEFLCRFCGMQKHADVNAACTVKGRRSSGLGDKFPTKDAILAMLTRQHSERFPRSQGAAADPRLTNRYWSVAARNALTQDLASCVQKQ